MSEAQRIAEQLQRGFEGEAWHGPALGEALDGVTAEVAAARPLSGAHSIWEIVLHLAVWHDVTRRRVTGESVGAVPPARDWPAVAESSPAAWERARRELAASHQRLRETALNLSDEALQRSIPDTGDTAYVVLHGVVQHDLYHAGQIALLKKAAAGAR